MEKNKLIVNKTTNKQLTHICTEEYAILGTAILCQDSFKVNVRLLRKSKRT